MEMTWSPVGFIYVPCVLCTQLCENAGFGDTRSKLHCSPNYSPPPEPEETVVVFDESYVPRVGMAVSSHVITSKSQFEKWIYWRTEMNGD